METLRELGRSAKQKKEYEKIQKQNRDDNDDRRKTLIELGLPDNGTNRMRLRLWQEQAKDPKNRICPYSGTLITARTALTDAIEEDHILPFAVTLDDSTSNRVLVTRESNRAKGKRTPFDAFGHSPEWSAILERVQLLPEPKRWRFAPDALEKFVGTGDFLARHLADSATIARWAKDYLDVLAPGKVWTIPGRLTSLLRRTLGLTSRAVLGKGGAQKERDDHRHHAIDALVVALTDRGLLQRMTIAAKRAEQGGLPRVAGFPPPWDGFLQEVAARVRAVVVSHKPDVGWQNALHNETAYGPIKGAAPGEPNVVVRRPLQDLVDWVKSGPTDEAAEPSGGEAPDKKILESVRDEALGKKIAAAVVRGDISATKAALANLTHSGGNVVRRVRTVKTLRAPIEIRDRRTGTPYKRLDGNSNHRFEVWRLPDGKLHPEPVVISTFDASQEARARERGLVPPDFRPHPAAKLVLRLHSQDMVAFGTGEQRQLLRVVKIEKTNRRVILAPPNEAGRLDERNRQKQDPFSYITGSLTRLRAEGARKVFVTPDGRVLDHGPVL